MTVCLSFHLSLPPVQKLLRKHNRNGELLPWSSHMWCSHRQFCSGYFTHVSKHFREYFRFYLVSRSLWSGYHSVPDMRRGARVKNPMATITWPDTDEGKSFCSVLLWIFCTRKHSEVSNVTHFLTPESQSFICLRDNPPPQPILLALHSATAVVSQVDLLCATPLKITWPLAKKINWNIIYRSDCNKRSLFFPLALQRLAFFVALNWSHPKGYNIFGSSKGQIRMFKNHWTYEDNQTGSTIFLFVKNGVFGQSWKLANNGFTITGACSS